MKTENNVINAKVVYKDVKNNQIVYTRPISGKVGSLVRLDDYKQYIPSNYQFERYGYFDHYLKNDATDVIYISKKPANVSGNPRNGIITVDYINADNQFIAQRSFTDKLGRSFNTNQCRMTVPKNYRFNRILTGQNINKFKTISQIMLVQVSKIKRAKITIEYLNNNKLLGTCKLMRVVGSAFNAMRYIKHAPVGYVFSKVDGQIPKVIKHDQVIKVEVRSKNTVNNSNKVNANHNKNAKAIADSAKLGQSNNPKEIGAILMKLASSLHDLGLTISKNQKL